VWLWVVKLESVGQLTVTVPVKPVSRFPAPSCKATVNGFELNACAAAGYGVVTTMTCPFTVTLAETDPWLPAAGLAKVKV
jgi:hypothetical protein